VLGTVVVKRLINTHCVVDTIGILRNVLSIVPFFWLFFYFKLLIRSIPAQTALDLCRWFSVTVHRCCRYSKFFSINRYRPYQLTETTYLLSMRNFVKFPSKFFLIDFRHRFMWIFFITNGLCTTHWAWHKRPKGRNIEQIVRVEVSCKPRVDRLETSVPTLGNPLRKTSEKSTSGRKVVALCICQRDINTQSEEPCRLWFVSYRTGIYKCGHFII